MRVFICWLINVCDWVGELSIYFMFLAFSAQQTNCSWLNQYIPTDPHFAVAGGVIAIIPSIITAIYAAINYELVLSWAVIRWMSPLNIVTNQFYYFIKTLFLSGAAWAAFITCLLFRVFPNGNYEWSVTFVKYVYHLFF